MKNYNKLLPLFIAGLVWSCSESFLELTPQQAVANSEALTNIDDYESSITGVYNDLSSSDYYGRYFILIPDVMADDVKQNLQANRAKDYAEHVANVADRDARAMWALMYRAINSANAIINSDVEVPASVLDRQQHIIGEAHALRGLIFFDLVRLYAQHYTFSDNASHPGIPLVLDFNPDNKPSRNTVKEVYDQVISDMNMAISLMKENARSANSNTLSKNAVKALLARVYLYKEDWSIAESMATEVINGSNHQLEPNDSYLNLWNNDNSSETLFEIAMSEADNNGFNALGFMYLQAGFGDYLPSNDVVSLYEPDDVRLGVFVVDPLLAGEFAPFRMHKYPDIAGWDNIKVIRLRFTLLEPKQEQKAEQMNLVRNRIWI